MSASFGTINYSTRSNKNVERKLMAEFFRSLESTFAISSYRYVGLGANTFIDFVLFHRELGISDMVSIERDDAARAAFNTPHACVRVIDGESTVVLPQLQMNAKRSLVWMDYDDPLSSGIALSDIRILGHELRSSSIVVISVNAQNSQLDDESVQQAASADKPAAREAVLKARFEQFLPSQLPKAPAGARTFGQVVGDILFNAMEHAIARAGRTADILYPLFNFYYKDGAAMVTVGAMIAEPADRIRLEQAGLQRFSYAKGRTQVEIDVPPLTQKEKAAIDKLLPGGLNAQVLRERHNFEIPPSQLEAYERYYKHYPVYSELLSS